MSKRYPKSFIFVSCNPCNSLFRSKICFMGQNFVRSVRSVTKKSMSQSKPKPKNGHTSNKMVKKKECPQNMFDENPIKSEQKKKYEAYIKKYLGLMLGFG